MTPDPIPSTTTAVDAPPPPPGSGGDADVISALEFAERLAAANGADEVARAAVDVVRELGIAQVAVVVGADGQSVVRSAKGWEGRENALVGTRCRIPPPGSRRMTWASVAVGRPRIDAVAMDLPISVLPMRSDGRGTGSLIVGALDAGAADTVTRHRLERVAVATSDALARTAPASAAPPEVPGEPTSVVSRTTLEAGLTRAIAVGGDPVVGVMSCDLDRFRRVNEALGYPAGDELLRLVGERLVAAAGAGARVAQLGGGELAVAFTGASTQQEVAHRMDALDPALLPPLRVAGQLFYPSASFGRAVATSVADVDEPDRTIGLLHAAERDLRDHEDRGRMRPQEGSALALLHLDADLHAAVEHDELVAHFQPVYSVASGRLAGFEALARWDHPRLGSIPREVFIALAEDDGLIQAIGASVLDAARRFLTAPGGAGIGVAVHVSTKEVSIQGYARRVAGVFRDEPDALRRLTVELTESALVLEHEQVVQELRDLRELGVGVAIGDFGSGSSSLSQLQELPATELRIDPVFVQRTDAVGRGVLQAILRLAGSLGLTVVAGGVEQEEQLDMLRELGCDRAQGYLFSPALPAELAMALPRTLEGAREGWSGPAQAVTVKDVPRLAPESPPTQTSNTEASSTKSRAAAFQ